MTLDLRKVADALDDLDSHGIYSRDALTDLAAAGIDTDKLHYQTVPEVARAIVARGLGGYVEHEKGCPSEGQSPAQMVARRPGRCTCRLYTGHVVAAQVLSQLGIPDAGARYFGRGSAHRARVEAIRKAAQAVTK